MKGKQKRREKEGENRNETVGAPSLQMIWEQLGDQRAPSCQHESFTQIHMLYQIKTEFNYRVLIPFGGSEQHSQHSNFAFLVYEITKSLYWHYRLIAHSCLLFILCIISLFSGSYKECMKGSLRDATQYRKERERKRKRTSNLML